MVSHGSKPDEPQTFLCLIVCRALTHFKPPVLSNIVNDSDRAAGEPPATAPDRKQKLRVKAFVMMGNKQFLICILYLGLGGGVGELMQCRWRSERKQ